MRWAGKSKRWRQKDAGWRRLLTNLGNENENENEDEDEDEEDLLFLLEPGQIRVNNLLAVTIAKSSFRF